MLSFREIEFIRQVRLLTADQQEYLARSLTSGQKGTERIQRISDATFAQRHQKPTLKVG